MDTESASASTASAAVDLFGEYEVFLSFCGKDTRYGFTDFLYTYLNSAGIRTFRDDNELRVGEEIGPDLLKAIKGSKISIPVFSKNYAFSKWCLLELAQMVECQANGGHMIFPIFYNVDPSEVRHQSGSYEEAFRQYRGKKRLDEKTVQGWEKALTKVGQLKGYELKKETGGYQGELVKIIVEKVQNFLKKNCNYESKNLVGMDNHMKKMKELLNFDFNGVRFIGIHGMGGLGKTTIAQTIYNELCKLFECHCFLKDVREISKSRNGTVYLQNLLLSEILKTKISTIDCDFEGINKIIGAVHGKKVFIVLDDVDEKSQIEKLAGSHRWFGAQSRIIITTRNEEVLRALEQTCQREGHPEVYRNYKPELMDRDHSLQLFSKYAFMCNSPPEGYDVISKKIASTASGLPLVLVTIGSSLFGEDTNFWEEKLRKLKEIPDEEVLEKLRLSFDPLDDRQKQIFLDIACFFIGVDKINPCYMWDDCKFYPRDGLTVLVRRSLITVANDNTLRMHDQLRDLGRQIVSQGNLNEPGRWSRVWRSDDALAIIETRQRTKNVKALSLDFGFTRLPHPACLVGKDLRKLQNLRYLNLNDVGLNGDFEHCLSNLRWLRWNLGFNDSKPRNLHMKNLLILDIQSSYTTDNWEGWSQIKMSRKLKVLDLSHCYGLWGVPYLSTFWALERLSVNVSLCSLEGIEELESLRYLNASSCRNLEELSNLSKLKKLEELHIGDCSNLIEIQGLDGLSSLELLYMTNCVSVERLPSLSSLKRLRTLEASRCIKLIEIQGLDEVDSLELLDISFCESLERLPNLSNLKRLKTLDALGCIKLTEILGLSELESLEFLDISDNDCIERLSDDMSKLKRLRELKTCFFQKLIEIPGLEELESLERLDMSSCISIERLPNLLNLGMLKDIQLCGCDKLHDVEGLQTVESLERLKLSFCVALGEMLDLTNLKNLKNLEICYLLELKEIRGLEELKFLEALTILGCKSIEKLPDFSNLGKLKVIITSNCEKLTEIRGLENLESLTDLYIYGCKSLQYLPHLPNTTIHGSLQKSS